MTNANIGKTWIPQDSSLLCLQYYWPIRITRETVKTIMKTQFIGFPGVIGKAFRLSLETNDKNEVVRVCCYVNSIELSRLGYKATAATVAESKNSGTVYELKDIGDNEATVFFCLDQQTIELSPGNHNLVFHLFLMGSMDGFSLCRFDGLLPQQLWNAAVDKQSTDVVFQVFDKTLHAHKFVLAARSPVFRAMFATDMVESRTGQVKIVDVESFDIFEEFLHFLYTGQLLKPTSTQLGMIAEKYQVETLALLCRTTVYNERNFKDSLLTLATTGKTTSVLNGRHCLNSSPQDQPTESDPLLSRSYTVHGLDTNIIGKAAQKILDTPYLFKVESIGKNHEYVVNFYSWAKESTLRVAAVDLLIVRDDFVIMKLSLRPLFSQGTPLEIFNVGIQDLHLFRSKFGFRFIVHRASLSNAFHYRLRDSLFAQQLWSSAVHKERTDVEFVVGGKTFPAHLAILAARCPALAALVPAESLSPSSPATVHILNVNPTVFSSLLSFLYTGTVEEVSFTPSLFAVARTFELDSLRLPGAMGGCLLQLDQDQLSDVLLSLFS